MLTAKYLSEIVQILSVMKILPKKKSSNFKHIPHITYTLPKVGAAYQSLWLCDSTENFKHVPENFTDKYR